MSTHTPASRLSSPDDASPGIEVIRSGQPDERLAALEIRRRVFGEEQGVADLRVADSDDAPQPDRPGSFPPNRRWQRPTPAGLHRPPDPRSSPKVARHWWPGLPRSPRPGDWVLAAW